MSFPVYIDRSAYLILALCLLVLPIRWCAAWIFAVCFHELCHLMVLLLFRKRPGGIRVVCGGIRIDVPEMNRVQELLCALAGPVGSISLLIFVRYFPVLSLCGLGQGVFNLLPIYPMDGGRILRCACDIMFPKHVSDRICSCAAMTVCVGIICVGLHLRWWVLSFLGGYYLMLRICSGKIPCKHA